MSTVIAPTGRCGRGPSDEGEILLDELSVNPYPTYRRLRDDGVVWVEAVERWLVSRWDDVDSIERNPDCFTARERDSLQTRVMGRTMLRTDGQEHLRLRRAAKGPLSPRPVESHWLPLFRSFADEIIDRFVDRGRADLITEFAGPFAARCLGAVLGLTDATETELQFWSQALMDGTANYGDDPEVWARTDRAVREVEAAVDAAADRVSTEPDESIIAAMVAARERDSGLSSEEMHANVKLIIGGGLNEPRDGIGNLVWALLTHPEQLRMVLQDASLWPRATEEALRWISPLAMFPREVAEPVRLSDTELEPGARVGLLVGSANRDERHWDRPEEFDITRAKGRNLAFGAGAHFCLGVWMSRHGIGGAAVPALFRRLAGLTLDLDQPAEFRGWVFRGPTRVMLRWGER